MVSSERGCLNALADHAYSCDVEADERQRILTAIRDGYKRFDPAYFVPDADGAYAPLGANESVATLNWLNSAIHLILSPRPGQVAADRTLGRNMILRAIRQGQFRQPGHEADGVWHWHIVSGQMEFPRDRNTSGFMGCALAIVCANDPCQLSDWPAPELAEFTDAVRASVESAIRNPVRIGYANPQVLDFYLGYVAADALNESYLRDHTRERLREFLTYASTTDAFEEYLSPTYMAVNLAAAVPLAHYMRGTPDEPLTVRLRDAIWRQIGAAAHGPTGELCGPHARAYGDTAIERANDLYAWLHLAAPGVFGVPELSAGKDSRVARADKRAGMYAGLAASGLYVPLGIPEDVSAELANLFQVPAEGRELFEWIGRCHWQPPWDLTAPRKEEPAPRFRLGTRYRAADFCLGSVNEQDAWLQRRSVLAYWKDAGGRTTGLKWQVRVEAGSDAPHGDWLFMMAIELASVQHGPTVLGAYHAAPVAPARPGDELTAPASSYRIGSRQSHMPVDPVGWLLGTHWRQAVERSWRHQKLASLWIGVTPIGAGRWEIIGGNGDRWAFIENGIEAVMETPAGARLVERVNRTADDTPVSCLEFHSDSDIAWDWLDLPGFLHPFTVTVQPAGGPRGFGLTAKGDARDFTLERGGLKLRWTAPNRPDAIEERCWWGWADGREIMPPGWDR